MNVRTSISVLFALAALATAGCGTSDGDPLLFDEDGNPRASVQRFEVDEAGIEACGDLDSALDSAVDATRVPVVGGEGEPVLVGVGGLALCLDEQKGGDDGGIDVDGPTGLDPDEALGAPGQDGSDDIGARRDVGGRSGPDRPTQLLHDPTPEPAVD